jgi:hypothetical protein
MLATIHRRFSSVGIGLGMLPLELELKFPFKELALEPFLKAHPTPNILCQKRYLLLMELALEPLIKAHLAPNILHQRGNP